jgi:hypothetical protein
MLFRKSLGFARLGVRQEFALIRADHLGAIGVARRYYPFLRQRPMIPSATFRDAHHVRASAQSDESLYWGTIRPGGSGT